ncbi:hypothetical protein [Halpernia sp.]|uniref:hypothetical protein n=1 Tax=Halpernia sp. TaxID=2782209 RepID=UPI003A951BB4
MVFTIKNISFNPNFFFLSSSFSAAHPNLEVLNNEIETNPKSLIEIVISKNKAAEFKQWLDS